MVIRESVIVYRDSMARTADHDARRAQICEGVRVVALSEGLPAVTVARTAEAAGVSVGLVQHYFPTKEDLLVAVYERLLANVELRVDRGRIRAERKHARIEQTLRLSLEQMLPLNRARRQEVYLELAFAGMALEDGRLRDALRRADRHLRERIRQAAINGVECGEVCPTVDADAVALRFMSTVRGLARTVYAEDTPAARTLARRVLAAACADVFAGPCARQQT